MPFIVIYDANVLYPNSLRDLLIRVAQADLVQAKQAVYAQVQRMADSFRSPPRTVDDVLTSLEHVGLLGSVAALRT